MKKSNFANNINTLVVCFRKGHFFVRYFCNEKIANKTNLFKTTAKNPEAFRRFMENRRKRYPDEVFVLLGSHNYHVEKSVVWNLPQ